MNPYVYYVLKKFLTFFSPPERFTAASRKSMLPAERRETTLPKPHGEACGATMCAMAAVSAWAVTASCAAQTARTL
jgi:hypothetical protein